MIHTTFHTMACDSKQTQHVRFLDASRVIVAFVGAQVRAASFPRAAPTEANVRTRRYEKQFQKKNQEIRAAHDAAALRTPDGRNLAMRPLRACASEKRDRNCETATTQRYERTHRRRGKRKQKTASDFVANSSSTELANRIAQRPQRIENSAENPSQKKSNPRCFLYGRALQRWFEKNQRCTMMVFYSLRRRTTSAMGSLERARRVASTGIFKFRRRA